jgi:hypothetical protein
MFLKDWMFLYLFILDKNEIKMRDTLMGTLKGLTFVGKRQSW